MNRSDVVNYLNAQNKQLYDATKEMGNAEIARCVLVDDSGRMNPAPKPMSEAEKAFFKAVNPVSIVRTN